MSGLATTLYLAAIPVCLLASAVGWLGWVRGDRHPELWARALGALAGALTLGAWLGRWAVAGHLPLFGTYESSSSLALAVLAVALLWRGTGEPWGLAGLIAAGVLAHGLAFDPTAYALTISERSWWVDLHAILAWGAFGVLALNAALAVQRLLPASSPRAESALSATLSLGFLLHSAMLATGSIYKFLLFGEAWTFDPVETLGFIAWIAYGTLLHLHLMGGWGGKRLARWCLGVFLLLIASYRGIVYFPAWSTYHIFDMDLRIHLTGKETR